MKYSMLTYMRQAVSLLQWRMTPALSSLWTAQNSGKFVRGKTSAQLRRLRLLPANRTAKYWQNYTGFEGTPYMACMG